MSSASTRNSGLRKVTKNPIRRVVEAVGEKAPWINANRITAAGTIGVFVADYLVIKHPKLKKTATAVHTGSSIADSFDGEWERWEVEEKGKEPSKNGPLIDVLADKLQEVTTFASQAIRARRSGNNLAAVAYLAAAATSPLPALFRARAESRGQVVKEGGLGTRPVRATIGAVGIAFADRPVLPLMLGAGTAAIESSQRRYTALQLGSTAAAVAVTTVAARQIGQS